MEVMPSECMTLHIMYLYVVLVDRLGSSYVAPRAAQGRAGQG